MGKKVTVSLSIILICTFTFINGYACVYPSFADSTTDQWTSVTTNEELAQAFEYYCKSRNLFIDGTVLGSATKFTTQSFDNICNTLGIDMSALQANIKKSTDSNGGLQYLFDTNGITAYNRIFAELLQNHNLQEGDTVEDYIVYSGELVEDADGNSALVFIVPTTSNSTGNGSVTAYGSVYKYTSSQLVSLLGISTDYDNGRIPYNDAGGSKSVTATCYHLSGTIYLNTNLSNYVSLDGFIYYNSTRNVNNRNLNMGYFTIGKVGNNYYAGIYNPVKIVDINNRDEAKHTKGNSWRYTSRFYPVEADPTDVSFTTNNLTINSNTYTDNRQTVINEQGDVNNYDYDNEDPPVNPPPSTSTPPTNTGGTDGDISFPDFDFQLPQINWSLGDLSEKFPFSIPFDLIAFFTVLNAEPQAPSIDANIPLGSWYTWHFQADFAQFNNWASIIRNVEFIAFCIGLIYLTIRLVKG